ncbi:hypothetical protein SGL43_01743 [Streptomyces globisporus]|uniref:Uncharacterized protein n=1 Tax=Streptomyces globisporus TaxID=1908 RepID=A0ABM9GVD2_STRGL|nr:hypothetical protein GCM10010264_49850 [Streptomyces globisporus]CAH9414734.1 hypothetical protein SGL43_01743 [Streptomyces globisporus]
MLRTGLSALRRLLLTAGRGSAGRLSPRTSAAPAFRPSPARGAAPGGLRVGVDGHGQGRGVAGFRGSGGGGELVDTAVVPEDVVGLEGEPGEVRAESPDARPESASWPTED